MRLTKTLVETAGCGPRDRFLWDTATRGFGVKITPAGRRVYVLQYRVGGREAATRRWTIGAHGSPWTVDTARREALRLLTLVHQGIDPRAQERQRREERVSLAFAAYTERFVGHYLKQHWPRSWHDGARLLRSHVVPVWTDRPLTEIGRRDLATLIEGRDCGAATARLLFATLRKLFNWAVERGDLAISPMAGMRGPAVPAARDRVLSDAEVAALWQAAASIGWPFGPIVRLLLATGARRTEVAGMDWRELDLATATWTLPAARSKNGQAHVVPLGRLALAELEGLPRARAGLLFSSTGSTPPSGFSSAKRRLDALMVASAARYGVDTPMEPWRLHDLRRTVATNLQRLGVRFEVTEAIMNHLSGARAGVAGVYQRHDWNAEKRHAITLWNQRLRALVSL